MSRQKINEVIIIRAIACLSIVLLHSVNYAVKDYKGAITASEGFIYSAFGMVWYFGTPTFIFISELLLAHAYKNKLPKGFFKKRIELILIPYIAIGFIFSFIDIYNSNLKLSIPNVLIESFKNIFLGDYFGWFVLVIFQFYILHMFFHRIVNKVPMKFIFIFSFLINIGYLSFFWFVEPFNIPYSKEIWTRLFWLPFPGWIFYFVLGYFCGSKYEKFMKIIKNNRITVLILPIITLSIIFLFTYLGYFPRTSKRPDMVLYACSMILCLFYLSSFFKRVPKFFIVISNYSFGIYLTHSFFLEFSRPFGSLPIALHILLLFICSVCFSLLTVKLINKFKYGKYIVGKIRDNKDKGSIVKNKNIAS